MKRIEAPEKREKGLRLLSRKDCRIGVGPLFSIKVFMGVGVWLRDTGRRPQKRLPKSPELPKL
ncbi:MAG TPA: hypothetical protein VH724_21170, partial [Candidatus Angelobacter sp.]|nr:hypothetical protein [Candidatus Angelobacter sp.]